MQSNVTQVVPFLRVSNMKQSLHFYIENVGFELAKTWEVDGEIRWCWITLGAAALMLQQFPAEGPDAWLPSGTVGEGIALCFQCRDAFLLYDELSSHSVNPTEPEVGNGMWVTQIVDPDGYRLFFESMTDIPEETKLSQITR